MAVSFATLSAFLLSPFSYILIAQIDLPSFSFGWVPFDFTFIDCSNVPLSFPTAISHAQDTGTRSCNLLGQAAHLQAFEFTVFQFPTSLLFSRPRPTWLRNAI